MEIYYNTSVCTPEIGINALINSIFVFIYDYKPKCIQYIIYIYIYIIGVIIISGFQYYSDNPDIRIQII